MAFREALSASKMARQSAPPEKIVAESEIERRQLIISYLSNILGDQYFDQYRAFAVYKHN